MVFWLRGANTATLHQSVRSQEIKPVMFTVLHKNSCEQKAWEVIPQNQDYVCVKALAYCWSICSDRSVRIPCLYPCMTATRGFKTTSTPLWVQTYLYTQKPVLVKAPPEIFCKKRTLTSRLWARTESNFEGGFAQRVGWPCPVSDTHTCCCPAAGSGRRVPPHFLCGPLRGDRDPQCATGTEPFLSKGFFHLWFRDAAKGQSDDNFWWHDSAGLGSNERFIRGEIPLPGPLATEC